MQTQLDLMIIQTIHIWILFKIFHMISISVAIFYGKLTTLTGIILLNLLAFFFNLLLASFTVTFIVKFVLVFKQEWFETISDKKLVQISKITITVYAGIVYLYNIQHSLIHVSLALLEIY